MTEEVKTKDKKICQNCRHQKNNPSRCSIHSKYVGRKNDECLHFNFKKGVK